MLQSTPGIRPAVAALLAVHCMNTPAPAAETEHELSSHTVDNAWLQRYDPTLVARRVLTELSHENDDDGNLWKMETSLRWGIPISEGLAFGVQAMVPVKQAENASGDAFGLGDLEFRTGLVGRFSPTLRYGAGINAELDTATDAFLGSNALVLRPILAIRWDADHHVNLGINVDYSFTPQDEGSGDVSALEIKFPIALKLTDH